MWQAFLTVGGEVVDGERSTPLDKCYGVTQWHRRSVGSARSVSALYLRHCLRAALCKR